MLIHFCITFVAADASTEHKHEMAKCTHRTEEYFHMNKWISSPMQTHLLHLLSGGMSIHVGQHTQNVV